MAAIKLHVLKPSVNNMAARVFVRAAKLDFTEDDVYGKTREQGFLARNPAHLTPMIETDHLPRGVMWESCAIMQYLCNTHHLDRFYPTAPAARAMIDSAMFYLVGTLYPYIARATYPALGFPQYAGEVGASDADAATKAAAQKAAMAAIAEPLDVFHKFYMEERKKSNAIHASIHAQDADIGRDEEQTKSFIGGEHPSIADIRLAATLEFLAVIDYPLPAWATQYMAAMEKSLGAAYTGPAADVRGYITYVKSQKK